MWGIPESSVYEAIAKLKQLGTLKIKTGKVVIEWTHSQQDSDSENPEFLRDPRMDSESSENFPRTQNEFRDPRRNSESSENQPQKDLLNKALSFSQTIQTNQTFQTLQTEGKGEKNNDDETSTSDQSKSDSSTSPHREANSEANENKSDCGEAPVVEKIPRAVVRHKTKIISPSKIPSDLQNKLEKLYIPLDKTVLRAIASHHLSQAYGAAAHVERTWETVKNPKSVFLYQISSQPVEAMPQPLSEEFLMWYQIAVAEGVVENLPPEHLSRDRYNEPLVRLARPDPHTGAPYRLVEWRRVQVEPDLDPDRGMASATDLSSFFKQLKERMVRNDSNTEA